MVFLGPVFAPATRPNVAGRGPAWRRDLYFVTSLSRILFRDLCFANHDSPAARQSSIAATIVSHITGPECSVKGNWSQYFGDWYPA